MRVVLEDDYTIDYGKRHTGFGTPEYIVKIQNNQKDLIEELINDPDAVIEELTKRSQTKQGTYEIKTPTGRIRIKKRPWNYRKTTEKYGLEFRANHYRRGYTYTDRWQRIDIQGRHVLVWDGIGTVKMIIPHATQRIDTSRPVWWEWTPHHHISSFFNGYYFARNTIIYHPKSVPVKKNFHGYVISPAKTYALHCTRKKETITYRNVPFIEGLFKITLPVDEITFIDTIQSVKKLPKSAEAEPIVESPIKWRIKNFSRISYFTGRLIYELRMKKYRITVEYNTQSDKLITRVENGKRTVVIPQEMSAIFLKEIKEADDITVFLELL